MISLGEKLTKARERKGKEVKQVFEETGISKTYIYDLEADRKKNPSLKKLKILSDYYNISIDWLLGKQELMRNDTHIPKNIANLLNDDEVEFIQDLIENEHAQILLRETRGMSQKDIATAIKLIKTYKEGVKI